ncbi:MAG: HsdM family class I SAM-dependent methyltransferase [Pyrinomonadaceae bacterium]
MKDGKNTGEEWAEKLGLVDVPLFSSLNPSTHSVLLDGGRGSFALSTDVDWRFDADQAANWTWSSDLAHHVWISQDSVTVSRWDDPSAERRWTRHSIENKIETFYEYLTADSIKSKFDVVEHSIDVFRRIRSYLHDQKLPDSSSIHLFLYLIASMLSEQEAADYVDSADVANDYNLDESHQDVFKRLKKDTLVALIEQFRYPAHGPRALMIIPELLVRHASGTVFQEAHFELIRSEPADLFSLPGRATVRIDSRGGTHFTPPPLARAVVEQAFGNAQLGDSLIVFDPSCGAGAFLHEVLRYLERIRYKGRVSLIGFDVSVNAVAIARFVLARAVTDCRDLKMEKLEVRACDSLIEDWPECDFILMNPPFISWGGLTNFQKGQVKSILGKHYVGRPDFSMAFIAKAITNVGSKGVVGTLLPSSVLSTEASLSWRRSLLDVVMPTFIGVYGDYGIFRHAIVEVASLVFKPAKRSSKDSNSLVSLWTSDKRGSVGEGIRHLRMLRQDMMSGRPTKNTASIVGEGWRLSELKPSDLKVHPDWRPRPNRLGDMLEKLTEALGTTLGDVFHVRQGIRAGFRKAFIIRAGAYQQLPAREKPFFRPVAENKNIRNGRVGPHDFVFYPETVGLPRITSEDDLKCRLPTYYERYLAPNKDILKGRKALRGRDWWILSWGRNYFKEPTGKIVTSYFGDTGSVALDLNGDYVVVQGFAWFFQPAVSKQMQSFPDEARDLTKENVLFAYLAILNSSLFSLLLGEFCPHVAGGQFNLSRRFVDKVPLPNLMEAVQTPELGSVVWALSNEGRKIHSGSWATRVTIINELTAQIYRVPFTSWPILDN